MTELPVSLSSLAMSAFSRTRQIGCEIDASEKMYVIETRSDVFQLPSGEESLEQLARHAYSKELSYQVIGSDAW